MTGCGDRRAGEGISPAAVAGEEEEESRGVVWEMESDKQITIHT